MRRQDLQDIALFGRVLSTGLVVAGYSFLSVWLSRWLEANDYPTWLVYVSVPLVVIFGMWQGWLFLTRGTRQKQNNKK